MATIDLFGDKGNLKCKAYFVLLCPLWMVDQDFKGPSLFVIGYHWLSLAIIDLVDDNRKCEVWGIFWDVVHIIFGW